MNVYIYIQLNSLALICCLLCPFGSFAFCNLLLLSFFFDRAITVIYLCMFACLCVTYLLLTQLSFANICININIYIFFTGAYGTVYRARDNLTGQFVAIKKVRIALTENGVSASTLREISLLKQLNTYDHANIVKWVTAYTYCYICVIWVAPHYLFTNLKKSSRYVLRTDYRQWQWQWLVCVWVFIFAHSNGTLRLLATLLCLSFCFTACFSSTDLQQSLKQA